MEHCQIRSILGKGGLELHLHHEFSPAEESLKMTARTDVGIQTGDFTFIDPTGVEAGFLHCSSMSGLIYTIFNRVNEPVATVTYHASIFTSKPVYFELKVIGSSAFSPQRGRDSSFFQVAGVSSCVSDLSFLSDDDRPASRSQRWQSLSQGSSTCTGTGSGGTSHESECGFGQLSDQEDEEYREARSFRTRRPTYNSESMCYLHNFGSRVKVAANTNFVLIRECDGTIDESEDVKHVVLRCGKLSSRTMVMDFRSNEVSTLIAFATACSTLVIKTLVA